MSLSMMGDVNLKQRLGLRTSVIILQKELEELLLKYQMKARLHV